MATVTPVTRVVYYAPTRGRSFLTLKAAARAEARALIARKYPTEAAEYDGGALIDSGWHWTEDERLRAVYERLAKRLARPTPQEKDL